MPEHASKLFDQLDTKHPDYVEWEEEWTRYRDVLGDQLVDKATYLPRNKFEPENQYDFRIEISQFIPESGLAIERLLGALFNEKPKREFTGNTTELEEFVEKATRKGESWNIIIEMIAFVLMGYGTTRILVNVPPAQIPLTTPDGKVSEKKPLSRKEEQDLGIRPFLTNYTPLSVIDWEHDEDGVLLFARIKEVRTVKDVLDKKKPHHTETRFIEYDRKEVRWWVFEDSDKKGEKVTLKDQQVRSHDIGIVPMVVEELREIKSFIGHSFVRYSSRADVRKTQAESDLAYDTYLHAHPFLAIWTEDELKEIGIGSSTFLKLNPGTGGGVGREDASYVEAPSSAFEALMIVINESRTQIFRQAQVDPMGIIASGAEGGQGTFQASGVARAWSFGTSEARILSKIADRMEAIEKQVFEIVLRWGAGEQVLGMDDKLFKGSIQYPEEFDLASTAQLIEERGLIGALVNSPTLLRIMDKRIAASKVGDATAKDLKTIQEEIDSNPLLGTMAGMSKVDPFGMPESGDGAGAAQAEEGGGEEEQGEGGQSEDNGADAGGSKALPRSQRAGVRRGGRAAGRSR